MSKFATSTAALVCQLRLVQSMQELPAQPLKACARQPFDLPTSTICWLNAMPKEMDTLSLDICALFQIQTPWDMRIICQAQRSNSSRTRF